MPENNQTLDYSKFKRVTGNRLVNSNHVNRIKESMKVRDLMIPIIINEKFEVIDGQHRLQARRELKLPVYYNIIKGLSIADTQKANANNKNWSSYDFINYYVELNYAHYKTFKRFLDKYRFDIMSSMALIGGAYSNAYTQDLRNGEVYIKDENLGIERAEKIYLLEPYYKGFRRRAFVLALNHAFNNPEFDFDEFLNKVSYQSTKLVDCTSVDQYLRLIEELYNFKRKQEDKIRLS